MNERMVGTPTLETVLDVCGHNHRRIVLAALANQQLLAVETTPYGTESQGLSGIRPGKTQMQEVKR
ncbi:MAG: hypothetical protein U5K28_02990 [Halobacteriales archaeon]|nr:hypothetical protein [Halobacteriales archaeon]